MKVVRFIRDERGWAVRCGAIMVARSTGGTIGVKAREGTRCLVFSPFALRRAIRVAGFKDGGS